MTAKDELESANRTITIKLARITEELGEEVGQEALSISLVLGNEIFSNGIMFNSLIH